MTTITRPAVGLCYGSGHAILVGPEALDPEGFGDVLCASCATPFHVHGRKHRKGTYTLTVPEHAPRSR